MPTRGLLILAGVTVIGVGASLVAIDQRYRESALERYEGGLVFPGFQARAKRAVEIEVERAARRFTLVRRDGQWDNRGVGGYPAIPARVERMLADIAALRYREPKTARPRLHPRLEVEDMAAGARSTGLTIKDEAGSVLADLVVGKAKESLAGGGGPGVYVRLPGSERAWLAEGSLDVRYDAVEWSDSTVADIAPGSLTALTVRHADGEVVALHRSHPDDRKLTLKHTPPGTRVEHQHQIDYMAGLLQDIRFSDARPVGTTGVDPVPVMEAIALSRGQLAVTLRVDEVLEDGSVWARVDAEIADDAAAPERAKRTAQRIRSKLAGWHVRLPRTIADRLSIRLGDIVETTSESEGMSR